MAVPHERLALAEHAATIAADAADLSDRISEALYARLLAQRVELIPAESDVAHLLKELFHGSPDVIMHRLRSGVAQGAVLVYQQGMTDEHLMNAYLIEPLLRAPLPPERGWGGVEAVAPAGSSVDKATNLEEVTKLVLDGCAVLVRAGESHAIGFNLRKVDKRGITRPVTEPDIYGPHDGFIEDLGTNLSLVRRRLRTPRLTVEKLTVGRLSATPVYVLHIAGVGDDHLVAEVRRRLGRIRVDGVLDTGQLVEFIKDAPLSPVPQMRRTERPDVVAAGLLEGRVAVMMDGSPGVYVLPITWSHLLKSDEDYFIHWFIASGLRLLRLLGFIMAMTLPALYVAITTYHQELIPTPLLLTLSASKVNVPLPALLEVLLMLVLFEIIREAGVRVPRGAGGALTIGGTLVVGDAAVRSGIVSTPITIIAAGVGIGFYIVPNYEFMLLGRMLTLVLLFAGAFLGIFGILFCLAAFGLHVTSLRSFGQPYMAPEAPFRPRAMRDSIFLRAPWWAMDSRPRYPSAPTQRRRQAPGQMPAPPDGATRG